MIYFTVVFDKYEHTTVIQLMHRLLVTCHHFSSLVTYIPFKNRLFIFVKMLGMKLKLFNYATGLVLNREVGGPVCGRGVDIHDPGGPFQPWPFCDSVKNLSCRWNFSS